MCGSSGRRVGGARRGRRGRPEEVFARLMERGRPGPPQTCSMAAWVSVRHLANARTGELEHPGFGLRSLVDRVSVYAAWPWAALLSETVSPRFLACAALPWAQLPIPGSLL